ncbi:MAG: thiamine-phosphate kinase [Dehalococcoidales bacterium]|nr:thiamine-phosphate kinase [Dehalococcoidales bacterium]
MKVSELGEFGLIDLLAKTIAGSPGKEAGQQLILGIGDDAAAWYGDTSTQLATVDSLIQDVHFSLGITPWHELGWKALAANLSDIAAMGGMPRYALVSLALPDHTEVEDITALYQGMIELSRQFNVAIVGGDTSRAPLVIITITVLGITSQDNPVLTRSGAKPGDKVAATGCLGTAAASWEMLTKQLRFNSEATACLKEAFLHPYPRIAEGQLLVEQGVKTAIDISDGLISDLNHICKASQVSARIEVERVPILPTVKANFEGKAHELALSGGEDYELLFTGSVDVINKVKTTASCPVTVIGEITTAQPSQVTVVDEKGKPIKIHKAGWEHFTAR